MSRLNVAVNPGSLLGKICEDTVYSPFPRRYLLQVGCCSRRLSRHLIQSWTHPVHFILARADKLIVSLAHSKLH